MNRDTGTVRFDKYTEDHDKSGLSKHVTNTIQKKDFTSKTEFT